jgi:hypothetical protein
VRASRDGGSSRHAAPERPASLRLMLGSTIRQIREEYVVLTDRDGGEHVIGNDYVFTMIGREPPLDFLRRSGVRIRGEWRKSSYVSLVLVLLACAFIFHWKKGGLSTPGHVPVVSYVLGVNEAFQQHRWITCRRRGCCACRWASRGSTIRSPFASPLSSSACDGSTAGGRRM